MTEELEKRVKCGLQCEECINRDRKDDCTDECDRGTFAKVIEILKKAGGKREQA